jgi:hypothetical protein
MSNLMLMLKSYVPLYSYDTWENEITNAHPWVSRLPQMYFKTLYLSLSKIWNMLRLTCYLNDLLIPTNSSFKDHQLKLEMVLASLSTASMRVNISKSKFFAEQIKYLDPSYFITRQGNQPIRNKVEVILNIKAPKTRKEEPATPIYWYSQLLSRKLILLKSGIQPLRETESCYQLLKTARNTRISC